MLFPIVSLKKRNVLFLSAPDFCGVKNETVKL